MYGTALKARYESEIVAPAGARMTQAHESVTAPGLAGVVTSSAPESVTSWRDVPEPQRNCCGGGVDESEGVAVAVAESEAEPLRVKLLEMLPDEEVVMVGDSDVVAVGESVPLLVKVALPLPLLVRVALELAEAVTVLVEDALMLKDEEAVGVRDADATGPAGGSHWQPEQEEES